MHCTFSNLISVVYIQRYSLLEILIYLLDYMNITIRTCTFTRYQSGHVHLQGTNQDMYKVLNKVQFTRNTHLLT